MDGESGGSVDGDSDGSVDCDSDGSVDCDSDAWWIHIDMCGLCTEEVAYMLCSDHGASDCVVEGGMC